MVTKAKKALLASLAAFLCVMLTVFGLSMSVSLSEKAKAADETSAVAQVGTTTYGTLNGAIGAAAEGSTVTLLKDTTEDVVVNKNITLDLNGFTLDGGTGTVKAAITNYGTLTIKDSSAAKTGTIKRDDKGVENETSYYVIKNLGTMTIEQANVVNNSGYRKTNPNGSMVGSSLICNGDGENNEKASLTINGGKLTQLNFIAIKNGADGTLVVNGGEITSNHSAIQNWYNATITGGKITGQIWTDAYVEHCIGKTVIDGTVEFTGEIVMDITGSIKPELTINGGNLSVTNWRVTTACAKLGGKPAVKGGTFTSAVPAEYCADRFIPTQNADGTYGVKACVAKVGSTKYETLAEAIAAAKAGDTITLLANVADFEGAVVTKNLTFDFGDYTITGKTGATVLHVKNAKVTLNGKTGGIDGGAGGDNIAVRADTGAEVIINGGVYTVGADANGLGNSTVYVTDNGKVTINGGTFSSKATYNGKHYVLNVNNSAKGTFEVKGGTFKDFDPLSGDDNLGGNFAPEGYGANRDENENFTIVAGVVAQVKDANGKSVKAYATLAEAIAAAKDGETVKLLADVEQNSEVSINKNITLDLNGKKIYNTKDIWGDEAVSLIAIRGEAKVTVMGDGTIAAKKDDCYTFNIVNGELTIENGTFVGNISVVQVQKGRLTINGGTFSLIQKMTDGKGADRYLINCIDEEFTTNNAQVAIYGGSFAGFDPNVSPEAKVDGKVPSFAAPGVGITKNENGSFTAKANMAAQILDSDGNSVAAYATLEEAVNAAVDGQTVMLLTNVTISKQLTIYKAITLDLNGKTLTSEFKNDQGAYAIAVKSATLTNGTIQVENARAINAKAAMTMDGVTVENGIIGGHATISLSGARSEYVIRNSTINGAYSVSIFANNATVTIENSKITGRGPALYHNGSNYGLRLTVTDTTLTSAECSVYISGSSSMKDKADNRNNADGYQQATFTRCTISGTNGIEVKYTNLTLNSCNISATVKTPTYEQNNNGSTASGFAVVSTDNATGGTTPAPKGTIAVSGEGNYVGAIGIGTLVKNTYEGFEDASYAVSGGTFNHAILPEYCAKGFIPTQNADGTFGVKEGTYVAEVNGVKYETLQAAIDKAARKAIVTLLANTKENVTIATAYLTLDLNGHTINGGTEKGKPAVTVKARVTIKDSSAAQTGTIMREDTAGNSGVSSHYVIDVQDGWLTFEGGKVINNSGNVAGKGASLVRVGDDSVAKYPGLNIKGGTFTQNNFIAIKVDRGDLFLNGGTVNSANSYAIEDWHRATVKGGTVNGDVAAWAYSGGLNSDLTISGGKINGNVTSVNYGNTTDKKATVSVTGGTIKGELDTRSYDPATGKLTSINEAAKATIEVTGGTFSKDPTKYVVEESAITENADGTFGVKKAYLAKVGDTSYYTMDEAFKAQTTSGEAIVLLRDYTTGSTFNSGTKHRVVDLNRHTWTYTGTDMNSAAFEINNPNATLTVKNGTIISSTIVGLIPSAMGGTIKYDNAGLVFDGVTMTSNGSSGIETNGNNTNDSITLKNSTLNVPNGFGIYFPSSGTLTIDKSTINAKTMGVQVCSGTLNINAGSAITVTGDGVTKTENDGAIQDGTAISIVNRTGYKGLSNIVITGGTFTAKAGNDAIKAYDWNNAEKTESAFTKADLVAVSGGTFSSEVKKDYLANGFRLTKTGESYGVTAKYIESTHVSLGTALSFSYKLRALKEGETIKNAKASYRTVRDNLVEIDMTLVDGYYVFDGITPQMLDRKISVNVYIGDAVVYDVVDYSILDYLQDVLNSNLGTKATVTKQLVADLAFYGKAAMNYVGYTTTVVDKFIKDNGLTQSTGKMTGVATSSGTEKVANVSVQFASQNKILIGVAESVFNDYTYTIKVNGTKIDTALWQAGVVDGYRVYVSDGFAASYITDKDHYVEVEVLKNEVSVQKVQCNVAGYCMKMAKNARMGELATATYYYGVSAAEYANFKG